MSIRQNTRIVMHIIKISASQSNFKQSASHIHILITRLVMSIFNHSASHVHPSKLSASNVYH